MKLRELTKQIDKIALFYSESMRFRVKIIDVKTAFGRIDYLVEPIAGDGSKWVSSERIKFNES